VVGSIAYLLYMCTHKDTTDVHMYCRVLYMFKSCTYGGDALERDGIALSGSGAQ